MALKRRLAGQQLGKRYQPGLYDRWIVDRLMG
jgi:hypothetical protein